MLIPRLHAVRKISLHRAQFCICPIEGGMGVTFGSMIRKTLLSYTVGAAITSFSIRGVRHELEQAPGICETMSKIASNLQGVVFQLNIPKLHVSLTQTVVGPVYAKNIDTSGLCTVVNPNHIICHLSSGRIAIQICVQQGCGFKVKDLQQQLEPYEIPVDACFSPVINTAFNVVPTKINHKLNADKLVIDVSTNGSITPAQALYQAVKTMAAQFSFM